MAKYCQLMQSVTRRKKEARGSLEGQITFIVSIPFFYISPHLYLLNRLLTEGQSNNQNHKIFLKREHDLQDGSRRFLKDASNVLPDCVDLYSTHICVPLERNAEGPGSELQNVVKRLLELFAPSRILIVRSNKECLVKRKQSM